VTVTASEAPTSTATGDEGGMGYLQSLPRRVVTVYIPLLVFVIVLLFPFYWMAITALKPNLEMTDYNNFSPFWVVNPTLEHIKYLLFETSYPGWLWNTIIISTAATILSIFAAVFAAYAIERLRFSGSRSVGLAIFLAYLCRPSILFIPLAVMVFNLGLYDTKFALILTYPTFLIPFCTWLLMGYFRSIPSSWRNAR
jgi:multiple sugar transport system permease protein